jgi:uronate dehydrogenase
MAMEQQMGRKMKRVLITGAAGGIGTSLRGLLRGAYPELVLSDRVAPADLAPDERFVAADLADLAQVESICEGVDGIVHLGGRSVEDSWEEIHPANIVGCYNLYEAARRKGVKRVIFASTNHVVGFYRRTRRIDNRVQPRPDSRYGVSKAYGEALAALYADKYGVESLCVRIGNYGDKPLDKRRLSMWLSPRDFVQLVRIGLEHPEIHFEIVYGSSHCERAWWDNSNAERLGYRPQDVAEDHRDAALAATAANPESEVSATFIGGMFCDMEFKGDLDRIR